MCLCEKSVSPKRSDGLCRCSGICLFQGLGMLNWVAAELDMSLEVHVAVVLDGLLR